MKLTVTLNEVELHDLLSAEERESRTVPSWLLAIVKAVRPDLQKVYRKIKWKRILEDGKAKLPPFSYDADSER